MNKNTIVRLMIASALVGLAACGSSESSNRDRNSAFKPNPCVKALGSFLQNDNGRSNNDPSVVIAAELDASCPTVTQWALVQPDGEVGKMNSIENSGGYEINFKLSYPGPQIINSYDEQRNLISTDQVEMKGSLGGTKIGVFSLPFNDSQEQITMLEVAPPTWNTPPSPQVSSNQQADELVNQYNLNFSSYELTRNSGTKWTIPNFNHTNRYLTNAHLYPKMNLDMDICYATFRSSLAYPVRWLKLTTSTPGDTPNVKIITGDFCDMKQSVRPVRTFVFSRFDPITVTNTFNSVFIPGNNSGDSSSTTSTTIAPINTPKVVIAEPSDGGVSLAFSSVALQPGQGDLVDYIVQYSKDAGEWVPLNTPPSREDDEMVSGLTNGATYTFRVAIKTTTGQSQFSDPSESVVPRAKIGTPTNVTATAIENGSVVLSWSAPASGNIDGYYIMTSTNGMSKADIRLYGTATDTTIKGGFQSGLAYTFQVRTFVGESTGEWSKESNVISPKTAPSSSTSTSTSTTTPMTSSSSTSEASEITISKLETEENKNEINNDNCSTAPTIGYQKGNESASYVVTARSSCALSDSVRRIRLEGTVHGDDQRVEIPSYDSDTSNIDVVALKRSFILKKGSYTITVTLLVTDVEGRTRTYVTSEELINTETPTQGCKPSDVKIVDEVITMDCDFKGFSIVYVPEAGNANGGVISLGVSDGKPLSLSELPSGWNALHMSMSYEYRMQDSFDYLVCVSECTNFANTPTAPRGVSLQWDNENVTIKQVQNCVASFVWLSQPLAPGIRSVTSYVLELANEDAGKGSKSDFVLADGAALTVLELPNCKADDPAKGFFAHHIVNQVPGSPAEIIPELIPGAELTKAVGNIEVASPEIVFLPSSISVEKPGVSPTPLVVTSDTKVLALDANTIANFFVQAGGNAVAIMSIDGGKPLALSPFAAAQIALPKDAKTLEIAVTDTVTGKTVTYTKEIVYAANDGSGDSSGNASNMVALLIGAVLLLLVAVFIVQKRRQSQS